MAVKKNNGGAIIGGIMTVVGGIMLFSSFSGLMDGLSAFFSAFSAYGEVEYAFEYAMYVSGGQALIGVLGVVLLFIGIMATRSAAAQAARNAAQKGGEAVAHARSEAEQRAREQQRAMEERAKQATRDAQARVQERQRAMAAGNSSGGQQGPSSSQTRLDQLRERFANDPRMEQVRQQAQARGYGDIADRYLPRAQPQQQGGQNASSGDGYGAGQNARRPNPQAQQPAATHYPNPMQGGQPRPQQVQRQPQPRPQAKKPVQVNTNQQRARAEAKAAIQTARNTADAFEAAVRSEFNAANPVDHGGPRKRQSALIASSLSTSSLSKTSLTTRSLMRTGRS